MKKKPRSLFFFTTIRLKFIPYDGKHYLAAFDDLCNPQIVRADSSTARPRGGAGKSKQSFSESNIHNSYTATVVNKLESQIGWNMKKLFIVALFLL